MSDSAWTPPPGAPLGPPTGRPVDGPPPPAGPPVGGPPTGPPVGGPPPSGPSEPPPRPWWKQWWAVAGGALLLVLVVAGLIGAFVAGDDDESGSVVSPSEPAATTVPATTEAAPTTAPETTRAPDTSDVPTTTAPETTEVPATTAPATTEAPGTTEAPVTTEAPPTVSPPAAPRCGYLGVDSFGDMQVELEFVNPLGAVPSVEVTLALLDGDGVRFHTDSDSFDLPRADERFRVEVDTVTEQPPDVDPSTIGCQVLDISEGFGYDDMVIPTESGGCQIDSIDSFGDIQITLSTSNPFDSTEDLWIFYALRGDGGARFDDSFAGVDFVGPGEALRVTEDTLTQQPEWVDPDQLSCDILGIRSADF